VPTKQVPKKVIFLSQTSSSYRVKKRIEQFLVDIAIFTILNFIVCSGTEVGIFKYCHQAHGQSIDDFCLKAQQ
jgi:hypothetical protein